MPRSNWPSPGSCRMVPTYPTERKLLTYQYAVSGPKIGREVFETGIRDHQRDCLARLLAFQQPKCGGNIRAGGKASENAFRACEEPRRFARLVTGDLQITVGGHITQERQVR